MQLLPLDRLGPHEQANNQVTFGFLLPWVSATNGNRLFVKLIHETDQFLQHVRSRRFELQHSIDPRYGDFWSGTISIQTDGDGSAWGQPGRYVYRYELHSPLLSAPLDWIVDPYAREYGVGQQSAFTLGYTEHEWGAVETTWKTPALEDLIVYELMIHEFSWDLAGTIERLPYLHDLGINCIELMPMANVARSIDWGFEPIGPFGPDERFGKRRDVRRLVEAAHANGIAVVLDMIYGHTGTHFAYKYIYDGLRYTENPFMGNFANDMFGPSVDYAREFTRDFFFTVNMYWLDRYHIDGIRYDCVPNYWDGSVGVGYANLVYHTYQAVVAKQADPAWQRFFNQGRVNLVQCAEQLEAPKEVVYTTYSNCTWQNDTQSAFNAVAAGNHGKLTALGHCLGLDGYPTEISHNQDTLVKSAFQYLENHDHSRFISQFGTRDLFEGKEFEGDRERWYKTQPYAIALLLAKGIPLLWEGQEIGESYVVPSSGMTRIGRLRPVRWEFFYDDHGRGLITLYRKLLGLRRQHALFRRGQYFFHNNWQQWQARGALLFARSLENQYALVALNFTDSTIDTLFWFPQAGNYQELLHGGVLTVAMANTPIAISIPSNYGRVWMLQRG
jgi:maltooligosyltrehalose trehalohydrolase